MKDPVTAIDTLFLTGLEVETVIGVFDWEREVEQRLLFDVELGIDMHAAAQSDHVNDALSYVDVAQEITQTTQRCQAKLLEHLAEVVAARLFERWPISTLRLRIHKPTAVAQAHSVGVQIIREAKHYAASSAAPQTP